MAKKGTRSSKGARRGKPKKKKNAEKAAHKLSPDELTTILEAAGLTPRKILASLINLTEKELRVALALVPDFSQELSRAEARSKVDLIQKARDKAEKGNAGDRVMQIFLLKSRCGFREADEDAMDTEEKAAAIRDTLERMNGNLSKFQTSEGTFDDTKAGK